MSTCRSCGAEIKWAKTTTGKSIPLDPHPHADGNIELVNGVAYVKGRSDDPADVRHISHFATCPNANRHRKRK